MPKKRETKDEPWIENYPPLRNWLRAHAARCGMQVPYGPAKAPTAYLEEWCVGKSTVIVVVYSGGRGWEIFSKFNSNGITETLDDASTRCGVPTEAELAANAVMDFVGASTSEHDQ